MVPVLTGIRICKASVMKIVCGRPQSLQMEGGPFPAALSTKREALTVTLLLVCVFTVHRMFKCILFHLIHTVINLMKTRLAKSHIHASKDAGIKINSQSGPYDVILL